jgi:hypothetical protein
MRQAEAGAPEEADTTARRIATATSTLMFFQLRPS